MRRRRKPLHELTPEDLIGFRVWRYECESDDDDAVVEATDLLSLTESSQDTYIALTEFTLNDGTVWLGYSSPSDPSGLDYVQPVITTGVEHIRTTGVEHIRLWEGPPAEEVAQTLNRTVEQVFPIAFESRVPVDEVTVRGVITRSDLGAA